MQNNNKLDKMKMQEKSNLVVNSVHDAKAKPNERFGVFFAIKNTREEPLLHKSKIKGEWPKEGEILKIKLTELRRGRWQCIMVNENKEHDIPISKDRNEPKCLWKKGDFCRSWYSVDGFEYETIIEQIEYQEDGGYYAEVKFLGYETIETVWLHDICESNGPEARELQIAEARRFVEEGQIQTNDTNEETKSFISEHGDGPSTQNGDNTTDEQISEKILDLRKKISRIEQETMETTVNRTVEAESYSRQPAQKSEDIIENNEIVVSQLETIKEEPECSSIKSDTDVLQEFIDVHAPIINAISDLPVAKSPDEKKVERTKSDAEESAKNSCESSSMPENTESINNLMDCPFSELVGLALATPSKIQQKEQPSEKIETEDLKLIEILPDIEHRGVSLEKIKEDCITKAAKDTLKFVFQRILMDSEEENSLTNLLFRKWLENGGMDRVKEEVSENHC